MGYFRRVGSTLSQCVNTIVFCGHPDESISARAYRTNSRRVKYIDFVLGSEHCKNAYATDIARAKQLLRRQ